MKRTRITSVRVAPGFRLTGRLKGAKTRAEPTCRSLGVAGGVARQTAVGALPIPSTFAILSVVEPRIEPAGPQLLQSSDGYKTDYLTASGAVEYQVDT